MELEKLDFERLVANDLLVIMCVELLFNKKPRRVFGV